jgi:hypothetical protein
VTVTCQLVGTVIFLLSNAGPIANDSDLKTSRNLNSKKMKKIMFIMMAMTSAIAFSCGDRNNNRSSEGADDSDADNTEQVEPDTTGVESDTTSVDGRRDTIQ